MTDSPGFVFVTCQVGVESALKAELARCRPDWVPSYSRPGFVTFKLPAGLRGSRLESVFARSHHLSLGKAAGGSTDERARSVWHLLGDRPCERIHVWERAKRRADEEEVEPTLCPAAVEARQAIVGRCPHQALAAEAAADPSQAAQKGQWVLDCVLVEPDEWWVGHHRAGSVPSRWAGGMIPLVLPGHAVSRAWLKMEEALRWSELPIPRGARCVEIGSAPGGASQALLDRGLIVTGVDPAAMAPEVLGHPNFTHIRRRSPQVRRREFRKARWLMADMIVAPGYTLDAVESIATHPEVSIRGLLLTLKLPSLQLASQIPQWLERIGNWGFNVVRARQLRFDRQEICVAALARPFRRKPFRPQRDSGRSITIGSKRTGAGEPSD